MRRAATIGLARWWTMSRALSPLMDVVAASAATRASSAGASSATARGVASATTRATRGARATRWTPAASVVRAYGRRASGRRDVTRTGATAREVETGDGVAYTRRGAPRVGRVERRDGKAAYIVREAPTGESFKVSGKAIDLNFGANADVDEMEAFATRAEGRDAETLLAAAWELIDEFGVEDGSVCDAAYVSELMFEGEEVAVGANAFAAHRLLSSPAGGVYFKLKAKGTYEARSSDQIEALKRKHEAETRAANVENVFLEEIQAAVAAPAGEKPDRATLWRSSEEDNDARARRLEALEAYALGEKHHSAGEKAMSDDLLGKLGFMRSPEGALKTLIATGTWSAHENLAVRRYGVQIDFPKEALAACASVLANPPNDVDEASRVDLTHLAAYAIDDAATVEVDDAVSAEALGADGQIRVWIHIADPTRLVPPGSPLDDVARSRGTTLYYPSEIVPMFPLDIAAGPMSLGAGSETSRAMSVRADVDAEGNIVDFEIMPSLIRLTKRWTYKDVDAALDSVDCDQNLRLLYKVALARDERRAEDGSITIMLPENDLKVEGATARGGGDDVKVTMSLTDAHTASRMLVSELMVLAGDVVARFGESENIPLPYRGQGEPRLMSDDEWDVIPEGVCQDIAMRSTMTASTIGSTPRPHYSLGLKAYVQFTSPIRRYVDMLAHYQIKAHLRGEPLPFDAATLDNIIENVGATVGGAIRSQRETTKYWSAVYFAGQPAGARWRATVVKFLRGDDLVFVVFDDLGYETVVKLERPAILGESITLRFVSADPHAGSVAFARVDA